MRLVIALTAVLGLMTVASALPVPAEVMPQVIEAAAAQQPDIPERVEIDIDGGGGAWWTSPTWIAIGVIALVLLIVVVAMAARGGGTTVIKD